MTSAALQETNHSMLRRCSDWDYRSPCTYLVTLELADRGSCALGRLVVENPECRDPETVKARVALSKLGEGVLGLWKRFSEFTPEVKPLYGVVMPDHFHGILQVTAPMAKPLGNAIGGFKGGCTTLFRGLSLAAQNEKEPGTNAASSLPGAKAPGLFAPGFNDKILFRAGELRAWFNYLADNPRRLAVKRLFPDLFKVSRNITLDLGFAVRFAAVGNHFLLSSPRMVQIQCSRALFRYRRISGKIDCASAPEVSTPDFREKLESALAAARRGATLVSPCVSEGEREIARAAYNEGLPLVVIKNMGFPPLFKPSGKLFDHCASGKLLLLAPANWPYQTEKKPMTRLDACAMNRIAQLVAKDGAVEIDYRGMTPANIDVLVKQACTPFNPVPGAVSSSVYGAKATEGARVLSQNKEMR